MNVLQRDFKRNVTVPVGVFDGYEIVVPGEGHQKFEHNDGDLVVSSYLFYLTVL